MYQSYFVCVYETYESTLIEYGNIPSTSSDGDVYLAWLDTVNPLQVRFYGFGNKEEAVHIFHVNTIQHGLMKFQCKGNTKVYMNVQRKTCVPKCHEYCEPFKGKFGFF